MGDWISGNSDAAASVIGGMFNIARRVQLCTGLLVLNPNSPKPMGIVLEINLSGWDLYDQNFSYVSNKRNQKYRD
jgi:hypothetical protein